MIRYAEKKDCAAVYALICDLEDCVFDKDMFQASFYECLKNQMVLVYEKNHVVAGLCSMKIFAPLHHQRSVAEIEELVVTDDERGKGIGKILINKAVCLAKTHACEIIELASGAQRTDAHRFYEREGFEKTHYKLTYRIMR